MVFVRNCLFSVTKVFGVWKCAQNFACNAHARVNGGSSLEGGIKFSLCEMFLTRNGSISVKVSDKFIKKEVKGIVFCDKSE